MSTVSVGRRGVRVGLLLPITSRSTPPRDVQDLFNDLKQLAESIVQSTNKEMKATVFVGIDTDDDVLLEHRSDISELFRSAYVSCELRPMNHPKGAVCHIWNELAIEAFLSGVDYCGLLGDDVKILTPNWLSLLHDSFEQLWLRAPELPRGFGCVYLNDLSSRGFPTFPFVAKLHLDAFGGRMFPTAFYNQDADPFLFEVYRRFHAVCFAENIVIRNDIGGTASAHKPPPRYERQHVNEWRWDLLRNQVKEVAQWLDAKCGGKGPRATVIDVVVPTYRLDFDILERIVKIRVPPSASTVFIVVSDNPRSPKNALLEDRLMRAAGHDYLIKARVNQHNNGAPWTRNHGMDESGADWILFLDDDVEPDSEILCEYVKQIEQDRLTDNPRVSGLVGRTLFKPHTTAHQQAITISGVNFFYDIANWAREQHCDVPWGVTANMVARRERDRRFDIDFARTGGGEDIDFCVKKPGRFVPAAHAHATHPWWDDGIRHFLKWGYSDGQLISKHPNLTYRNFPNVWEWLLFVLLAGIILPAVGVVGWRHALIFAFFSVLLSLWGEFITQGVLNYRRRWALPELTGWDRVWPCMLAGTKTNAVEVARFVGHLRRFRLLNICKRFDWFAGKNKNARAEWRRDALICFVVYVMLTALAWTAASVLGRSIAI